jgi:hypothetical protein
MTPQARAKRHYEALGYTVWIVERWIPQARRRIDLYGMFDLLAITCDMTVGVQATTGAHVAERVAKMQACPHLATWCAALNREAHVIGFSKRKPRGAKRATWEHRLVNVEPLGIERYGCQSWNPPEEGRTR